MTKDAQLTIGQTGGHASSSPRDGSRSPWNGVAASSLCGDTRRYRGPIGLAVRRDVSCHRGLGSATCQMCCNPFLPLLQLLLQQQITRSETLLQVVLPLLQVVQPLLQVLQPLLQVLLPLLQRGSTQQSFTAVGCVAVSLEIQHIKCIGALHLLLQRLLLLLPQRRADVKLAVARLLPLFFLFHGVPVAPTLRKCIHCLLLLLMLSQHNKDDNNDKDENK